MFEKNSFFSEFLKIIFSSSKCQDVFKRLGHVNQGRWQKGKIGEGVGEDDCKCEGEFEGDLKVNLKVKVKGNKAKAFSVKLWISLKCPDK